MEIRARTTAATDNPEAADLRRRATTPPGTVADPDARAFVQDRLARAPWFDLDQPSTA